MKIEEIHDLFDKHPDYNELEFTGACHDCKKEITVLTQLGPDGFRITGGSVFRVTGNEALFFKCDACLKEQAQLREYQPCEVYARCVGYLRPINQWNPGKKAEFHDRTDFNISQSQAAQGLAA
jgi:hypothetical protein